MKRIRLIFLIISVFALIELCLFLTYINAEVNAALTLPLELLTTIILTFTHLVLAALIILERDNLSDFYVDNFTVYIFVFASFFRVREGVIGENISLFLIAIAGMAVGISLFRYKVIIKKTNLQWAIKGISAGLFIIVVAFCLNLFIPWSQIDVMMLQDSVVFTGIKSMFYVFPDVILEEILFRGFLWGYLKKVNWNNNKIAWFQGILFWGLHFSRAIVTPITFIVIIPLLTFISTKLLLKSQQTFPSILSHAVVNVMSKLFYLALI
jgi:hypothetical protein